VRILFLKKILGLILLSLFLSTNLFAGVTTAYKKGKGPLKVTKNTADNLEFFFSGGKKGVYAEKQDIPWKPGLIAISVDGVHNFFFRHPLTVSEVDDKSYGATAIMECKKKSGQECFLFANGYKIVWDNGSNKKKRKLKKRDIKAGKTIALLTELGFYDGSSTSTDSVTPKIIKKKKVKKNISSKRSIAVSWDGYEDLILGTVGLESDEGQTIMNLQLPNGDSCEGIYLIQRDGKGTWQIACSNNMGAAGTLEWDNEGGVTGKGRDHKDKKVKFIVSKQT